MSDRAEDNLNYRSNKEAKKVGKFTGNYTQTGRKIYNRKKYNIKKLKD